jgi:cytochrome c biogenesis protein
MLKKIFALLRSLKITAILISYFIIAFAVSSFFPQLHIFRSPFFLIPVLLFFINLLSCAIYRFRRELKKDKPNFGPDILHSGLLLFIIAAFLSAFNRIDGSISLSKGQQAILPNNNIIVLDDLEYAEDHAGRPGVWKSYLSVFKNNTKIIDSFAVEVNHPLKIEGFTLYQSSYGRNDGEAYTVLRAVWDPGYAMVVISLIIIGIGIFITMFIKLHRRQS